MLAFVSAEVRLVKDLLADKKPSFGEAFTSGVKGLVNPQLDAYNDGGIKKLKENFSDSFQKRQDLSNEVQSKSLEYKKFTRDNGFENAEAKIFAGEISNLQKQLAEHSKQFATQMYGFVPQSAGDIAHLINSAQGASKFVAMGIVGGILGLQAYNTYNALADAKLKQDIYNHLQTKMIGVANYIRAVQELAKVIFDNFFFHGTFGVIPDNCGNALHAVLLPKMYSLSKECQKLLKLLNHNTFTGNASVFSLTGRILKAHTLMQKVKEEFVPACAAAGQLDAYLSTAKLYKKHQNTSAHFCFATFDKNSTTPFVKATGFWNLFIDPNTVVVNSIGLGIYDPNNIVLTGPNTGGKSTVIKGLLINILLAQTLTVAPAQELLLTPFANLNCYLNVTDDLTAGTSLFKAEVLRAKALITAVRNLKEGEFSFTIIDEIFSGTSPKEGEEAAVKFSQELGTTNNSMCCVATHFPRLTEELSLEHFKNYRVTVYKDEHGNWARPFTLEEGKSDLNIAMDLLKDEGIF